MSVKLKTALASALALCAVLFCSCGTKEELFDSYDSCFVPIPNGYASFTLTPDTQSLMLPEVYKESFDYPSGVTFCLSCPVECDEYYWFVTPEGYAGSETVINDLYKASLSDGRNGRYYWRTRNVSFYISKSKDCVFFKEAMNSEQSCSYHIYLVVKVGNDVFHDRAVLVIRALTEAQKKEFQPGN